MKTKKEYQQAIEVLFMEKDEKYRLFHEKLLCSGLPVVGIRVPLLRKKAKELAKAEGESFLKFCGKDTYEERLLYGLVLAALNLEFETFCFYCDIYANELVENWAHCDVFCASLKKIATKNKTSLFLYAKKCIASSNPWVVRVGLVLFLDYYLTPEYLSAVLEEVGRIKSDFYYIEMAQGWLLATAWAKNPHEVKLFLAKTELSASVKNKFVQKARDSYRVSAEDKKWLLEWKKAER